jgi:hypothetical protein
MRGALWVSIVWGVSFVVSGCAGVRGRADVAFERGDYVGAADQYGALAETSPEDASLRARRDDARSRALIVLAIRASKLRAAGRQEPALATLADLLSRRRAWREVNSDAAEQAISGEIARPLAPISTARSAAWSPAARCSRPRRRSPRGAASSGSPSSSRCGRR